MKQNAPFHVEVTTGHNVKGAEHLLRHFADTTDLQDEMFPWYIHVDARFIYWVTWS